MYHNASSADVDSFSTRSNGTIEQPQKKGEGNCYGKNADIGYISMPVARSGPYQGIHLGTHLWTNMDV